MTTLSQNILDISALPDTAKKELITFYEFLLYRHNLVSTDEKRQTVSERRFASFLAEPIRVIHWNKYSREELHER